MGPYEYVVESIAGEYAYLRRTDIYDNGEPMMIAMALLPDGWTWAPACGGEPGVFRAGVRADGLIFPLFSRTIWVGF